MPIPVMTTRLMLASSASPSVPTGLAADVLSVHCACSGSARLRHRALADQCDLDVHRPKEHRAIGREPTVRNAQHELAAHHALDVDAVNHPFHGRQNLAAELQLAQAERAALAGLAEPGEEKAQHLPQRIEAEAARHHRIALEVAREEPQVGLHVELGPHPSLAVLAAVLRNLGNSLEHQHGRQRQLGIALAEQFTPPTGQEILVIVAHAPGLRSGFRCNIRFRHGPSPIWRCPNTALAADKAARRCDMTRLALKYGWHSARPNPHKYAAALLRESCTYRAVSPMIAFATILGRDQPVREGF